MTTPLLPTATLAELYVRQGLIGRAREIYLKLAAGSDPSAAKVARGRLDELPSAEAAIAMLQGLLERVQRARRRVGED